MDSLTDPSDWGEVEEYSRHGGLRELDSLLRCPICYGFLNGALIIPDCGHTFCSLCIRRYLRIEQVCPICRREALESRLVNNRLVDQLAIHFIRNRSFLIRQTMKLVEHSELDVKKYVSGYGVMSSSKDDSSHGGKDVPSNETKAKLQDNLRADPNDLSPMKTCPNIDDAIIIGSSKDGNHGVSSVHSEILNVQSPNASIASHLNHSSIGENSMDHKINLISHQDTNYQNLLGLELISDQVSRNIQNCSRSLKRKSKYTYRLMDTKKLKKLLQDDKLPTRGDKEALIWRHQEYCLLYNANLDSLMPKTEEQLRDQVLSTEMALLEEKHRRKSQKLAEGDEEELTRLSHLKKYSDHFDQVRKTLMARNSSGPDLTDS